MQSTSHISCFQLYQDATRYLRISGITNAQHETAWLLEHVLNLDGTTIHAFPSRHVSVEDQRRAWHLIERRALGEPIQYLLGTQEFCGLDFLVSRDVLIPRPDTELLVQVVSSRLNPESSAWVLDVGTGSGCIAITLAASLSLARVIAMDLCSAAIRTAKENAARHRVLARINFLVGDLLSPLLSGSLEGKVAAIVANLPYISHNEWDQLPRDVREFEPTRALDGGEDGLILYRRLLDEAVSLLMPNGFLALEVGKGQASRLCQELDHQGWYRVVEIRQDTLGIERVVCLERKV